MKHTNSNIVLAFLTLLALPAGAATVVNPSFETPTLVDEDFTGDPLVITWQPFNTGTGTGGGAYNPSEANFTGAAGSGTPAGADGTNVYSTNASLTTGNLAGASQVLAGLALTTGTLYTLTVAIGHYADLSAADWNLGISTSSMAFGTFLNTSSGLGASLTSDAFNDYSVSYTATGLEPQNLEDLKITFWSEKTASSGQFVPFDNVRFEAVAAPEPSATLLGGIGLLSLIIRRRRN